MRNLIIITLLLFIAACDPVQACTKTESPKARFVFLHKNGLYGLLDENGNEIVPAEYLYIDKIRDGMIPAFTKEKMFVFLDETGKRIKDVSFYDISPFYSGGLLAVIDVKTRKEGVVDKNLNYVIKPQFDAIINHSEDGIINAKQGELWGVIDKTGKYILEPQFEISELEVAYKGTFVVSKGGKIRLFNAKKAEFLDVEYDEWYGITGNKIVLGKGSSIYLNSWENKEIFLMKKPRGRINFIDEENSLGDNRFFLNYKKEGEKDLHFVVFDSSTGEKICDKIMNGMDAKCNIDGNCNIKEKPHYDKKAVEENERKKYGKFEEVRHGVYETSTSFKQNGKWGFLDEDGNVAIPAEYDEVTPFYFDVSWVQQGDRRFIIDRSGKKIVEIKPEWKDVNELRYTMWDYYQWGRAIYCFQERTGDPSEYWYKREEVEEIIEK